MTKIEELITAKMSECTKPSTGNISDANFFWVGQAIGLNTALNIYKTETAKERLFTKENILYINKLYETYLEEPSDNEYLTFDKWFEQLNLDTL